MAANQVRCTGIGWRGSSLLPLHPKFACKRTVCDFVGSLMCGSLLRRCTLPQLEELELASISLLPPNGDRLLQQLVVGSAGSLRRLDLHSSGFSGELSMLSAATALTWLNLAGGCSGCWRLVTHSSHPCLNAAWAGLRLSVGNATHHDAASGPPAGTQVCSDHLADLALLPLRWLSLAGTRVGDRGVAQLLAMPLQELNLRWAAWGDLLGPTWRHHMLGCCPARRCAGRTFPSA